MRLSNLRRIYQSKSRWSKNTSSADLNPSTRQKGKARHACLGRQYLLWEEGGPTAPESVQIPRYERGGAPESGKGGMEVKVVGSRLLKSKDAAGIIG